MIIVLASLSAQAQMKVQSDGHISLGTLSGSWTVADNMTIDYIKVYQLHWDCDTDETIRYQHDLNYFDFAVKKNVMINPANGCVSVDNSEKITFRITDSFTITGEFQVENGAEFTVIQQSCPE